MIGTIIKLLLFVIVVLVGLKIFMPEMADKAVDTISKTTGVDKSVLEENLNKATDMTIDGAQKLAETTQEKLSEAKEKLENK